MKKILLFLILVTATISINAQDKYLLVVDKTTGEPVPFANVCFEDLESGKQDYTTTDQKGIVVLPNSGKVELSISFIGYISYKDKVDFSSITKVELVPDIFALNQVVVTGQGKPMLRDSSIYSIKIFDSKLIEQRGAVNLGDVLSAQPSIKIKQSGTFGSNIEILGLGGENVKIMIDGVPIIGRLDGNLDLSQITMENVDHIEIVEGPMSVIYGSNALAGTINIITKNNKWNKFLINANTYVESPGTINANILVSSKVGSSVITGSLARNYFEGISFDEKRQSKWKGSTQYIGDLNYAYYGKKFTFRTSGKYFNEFMKDKGEVFGEGGPTPNATDINFITNRASANAFLDLTHNEKMQTNIQASVSNYNRVMQTVRTDMTDLSESEITSDTTTFINFMSRATFNHKVSKKVSYQTGIDINSETGNAERIEGGQQSISDYAIFITGKHELWDGIIIQPGLRYAYNTKFSAPLLYSINVKADLSSGWQARASFAKGFRAPTLKEMYLDFAHAGLNIIGNPDLDPESSYTFNASVDYTFRDEDELMFKTELKGYYNNVYNKIDFAKVDDVNGIETWQNINRGNIETLGWVANADLDLNSKWSFNANFSRGGITSLEYEKDNSNDQYVFTNNFLTSVTYKINKYNFSTRLEYAFNGEEPARYIDDNTNMEPMVESYNDLNLTFTKSFFKRRLNLTMGVKNILDNTDLDYIGSTPGTGHDGGDQYRLLSWGRSYFVKLNFKLNKN